MSKDYSFTQARRGGPALVHKARLYDIVAEIAVGLVERWGMVAAVPDGEDSNGRQRVRMMTPEEIVGRACSVADLLVAEFEERDWVTDLPEPTPFDD